MSGSLMTPAPEHIPSDFDELRSEVKEERYNFDEEQKINFPVQQLVEEEQNPNSGLGMEDLIRDPRQIQNPFIDEDVKINYEACNIELDSIVDSEGLDLDRRLTGINPRLGNHQSINSGQNDFQELNIDLLQCGRDCETCQKYIRKLKEHVRAAHGKEAQPSSDPLAVPIEIKCEVDEVIVGMDCSKSNTESEVESESANDPDPDYTESPLTQKSQRGRKLRQHLRDHSSKCETKIPRKNRKTSKAKIKIPKEERPSKCDECGNRFKRIPQLIVHKRTHSGEAPFQCDECGKGFKTKGNLTVHKRNHAEEKPFKCELCGNGYITWSSLNIHKRVHTGEILFQCDQCERGFTRKDEFTVHLRVHSGVRPFSCEQCGKSYTRSGDLTVHLKTHLKS